FRMRPRSEPPIGRWLARLLPHNLGLTAVATIVLIAGAGVVTAHYLVDDPFESNFKNLRSRSPEINQERRWMHDIDQAFGQGIDAGFVIALPRRADVMPLKQRLRAADTGTLPRDKLFSSMNSLDDLLPSQQTDKLVVLDQIRELLDAKELEALSDADRAELA